MIEDLELTNKYLGLSLPEKRDLARIALLGSKLNRFYLRAPRGPISWVDFTSPLTSQPSQLPESILYIKDLGFYHRVYDGDTTAVTWLEILNLVGSRGLSIRKFLTAFHPAQNRFRDHPAIKNLIGDVWEEIRDRGPTNADLTQLPGQLVENHRQVIATLMKDAFQAADVEDFDKARKFALKAGNLTRLISTDSEEGRAGLVQIDRIYNRYLKKTALDRAQTFLEAGQPILQVMNEVNQAITAARFLGEDLEFAFPYIDRVAPSFLHELRKDISSCLAHPDYLDPRYPEGVQNIQDLKARIEKIKTWSEIRGVDISQDLSRFQILLAEAMKLAQMPDFRRGLVAVGYRLGVIHPKF
ncbi:hypothetical protein HYS93_04605 [Candidatus Daviesbacteria bacterium]|nr:hypothetical protein [Candidatus Daviesbacteria bacterium]